MAAVLDVMVSRLELPTAAGTASVELSKPRSSIGLLVLTHGAGGGVETADLLAVRDAAGSAGIAVALLTQPYRAAGRRTPPTPARQDEAWLAALARLVNRPSLRSLPLVLGGRSNGARVACRTAVAAGARAVVALAFPVHPPGKPQNSRLAELDGAGVPVLVVQGASDPFGMPPAAAGREVVVIEGADHNLRKDVGRTASAVIGFVLSHL